MHYRSFGNTGMQVSRYCLGAMTFGAKLEQQAATNVLHEAIDHGVNFIDTADSYGQSEELLGKILDPEKRERVYLATKVYKRFCRDGRGGRNSRVNIRHSLERSLRLLQTDYVDLYQLHHPDDQTPIEETLTTLESLIDEGKIRYYGVSNHYAWQMAWMNGEAKAHNTNPLISIQANYNIIDRQIEQETLPFCRRFNIALMCYGPLCGGVLTGKYHFGEDVSDDARGANNSALQQYIEDDTIGEIVRELKEIADDLDLRLNQLAVLWLLSKPAATVIILGGSKPEHFRQLYEIEERELPNDVVERIDNLSRSRVYAEFRNQPVREGPDITDQL